MLQEWAEFAARRREADRLEFVDGATRAAGQEMLILGTELATITLKAHALARAALSFRRAADDQGTATALRRLMALPPRESLTASPMVVEALLQNHAGRAALIATAHRGGLLLVPAESRRRDEWERVLGIRAASTDSKRHGVTTPVQAGVILRFEPPTTTLWKRVHARMADTLAGFGLQDTPGDDTVPMTVQGFDERRTWHLVNPAFARIATESSTRRALTAAGIVGLLMVMVTGLFLVRRAFVRERRARQLRDDFIANISHELRTPLTSVRLHAEMLGSDGLDAPTRRAYGRVVEAEGSRLSSLVEDLLDFAALSRGQSILEPAPMNLSAAGAAIAAAWQPWPPKRGAPSRLTPRMRWLRSPTRRRCRGSSPTCCRTLSSTVDPPRNGGPPSIEVRVHEPHRGVAAIDVADNGPGVTANDRDRIFDRFGRGNAARHKSGAGIGLALSRELARAMQGDLCLVTDRKATVFRLTLPVVLTPTDGSTERTS